MKTLFVFLCLSLAFTSCTKDNPVSTTEDPNGYSNYELYLDGIKIVSDCEESGEGEFFYTIAAFDFKDSLLGVVGIDADYRKKAKDDEFIDINRTLKFKMLNSQSFKLVGQITEYNSILANEEIPFRLTYTYPYNVENMNAKSTLDGKGGYSTVILNPKTGCAMILFFKLTKV